MPGRDRDSAKIPRVRWGPRNIPRRLLSYGVAQQFTIKPITAPDGTAIFVDRGPAGYMLLSYCGLLFAGITGVPLPIWAFAGFPFGGLDIAVVAASSVGVMAGLILASLRFGRERTVAFHEDGTVSWVCRRWGRGREYTFCAEGVRLILHPIIVVGWRTAFSGWSLVVYAEKSCMALALLPEQSDVLRYLAGLPDGVKNFFEGQGARVESSSIWM